MRAMPIVSIVIALGLILGLFTAIGLNDAMDGPTTEIDQEVNDTAEEAEKTEIDPDEAGETGFLSFTISGVLTVWSIMQTVVFLPSTLETLGFPTAFASMIGHGAQIVVAIGIVQVVIGNEVR